MSVTRAFINGRKRSCIVVLGVLLTLSFRMLIPKENSEKGFGNELCNTGLKEEEELLQIETQFC
jgi:hypothetical protein